MKKDRRLAFLLIVLLATAFPAGLASGSVRSILQQASIRDGRITAYLDIVDENSLSVAGVESKQLEMFFDGKSVQIDDLRPFAAAGEGVATVLLLDVSQSMSAEHFKRAKKALSIWADSITPLDAMALIAFGDTIELASPFGDDRNTLKEAIAALQRTGTTTPLYDAIIAAYDLLRLHGDTLPARRAIVILSDGIQQGTTETNRADVLRKIEDLHIPLHSIVYTPIPRNAREKEMIAAGRETLAEFSRISGGICQLNVRDGLRESYAAIHARIRNSYVVTGRVRGVKGDDKLHVLQIHYATEDSAPSAGVQIPYPSSPDTQENRTKKHLIIAFPLIIAMILLCIHAAAKKRGGKRKNHDNKMPATATFPGRNPTAVPGIATKMAAAPVEIQTKPRGIKIHLTPLGPSPANPYSLMLKDRAIIGRSEECRIRIADDPSISGRHCELSWTEGTLFLRDLNSKNGTSVNGIPCQGPYTLKPDDVIGLGRIRLRLGVMEEF